MARNYRDDLRLIRPYTGKHFTAANGYSLSKKPNIGQRMAVMRYAQKIEDMLSVPVEVYTPKKGDKSETFRETGQEGFAYFTKAIVPRPPTPAVVRYSLDKNRPRGSQLVATDTTSKQKYYHLPAELFLESEEIDTEFYEAVLEEYAEDATFFLIQAGQSYMWGSALGKDGTRTGVSKKLADIFRNYSATLFDANNKSSSYYGNWFRGVTAFTSVHSAVPAIRDALNEQARYRKQFNASVYKNRDTLVGAEDLYGTYTTTRKFRNGRLVQGWIHLKQTLWGHYVDGILEEIEYRGEFTGKRMLIAGKVARGWIRIRPPRGEKPAGPGQNYWGYFVDGIIIEREWR